MTRKKMKKILKCSLVLFFIVLILFLSVRYFVPLCKMLGTEQGREQLALFIEQAGIFAPLVFVLMMALQIVIAFIPGGPLEITGGFLFGGLLGTVLTAAGAFLGTLLVYTLVRKFGRPLVSLFVSEEKFSQFSVLQNEDKLEFWVFVLFLIPGIPKDLLTYIVPLTKIQCRQFLVLSTIARFPALMASVLVGDSLYDGRYGMCIAIACISAVLAFAGFELKKHIMKEKHDSK
ncbi:MAG: TVP38/TMEM64 family protein [Oscillospiraceae bacterium]|nr:TVP38/TMEM64 family protein [Oscillospiraceae bacterium]